MTIVFIFHFTFNNFFDFFFTFLWFSKTNFALFNNFSPILKFFYIAINFFQIFPELAIGEWPGWSTSALPTGGCGASGRTRVQAAARQPVLWIWNLELLSPIIASSEWGWAGKQWGCCCWGSRFTGASEEGYRDGGEAPVGAGTTATATAAGGGREKPSPPDGSGASAGGAVPTACEEPSPAAGGEWSPTRCCR